MYSFIFPCEPFNIKKVDEHFKEEFDLFKLKGFNVCLIDLEEKLLKGNFDCSSKFIYRGWMLSNQEYDVLESLIKNKNCFFYMNHGCIRGALNPVNGTKVTTNIKESFCSKSLSS